MKEVDFSDIDVPLHERLILQGAAGIASAVLVSPLVSIIDVAIFSNASGKESLVKAITSGLRKMIFQPNKFFSHPSFYLTCGIFSGTYVVANCVHTICEFHGISWFYPKFIASSFTNVKLSVLRDIFLTRSLGKGTARQVPLKSYGLYGTRDSLTIFASFNLPSIIAKSMTDNGFSYNFSITTAQLIAPCAVQILSTPLHLLGMDLYNRPDANRSERLVFIQKEYFKTTLARISRIFQAFGIGGVANIYLRKKGDVFLQKRHQRIV